jgi:beta-phosphoglucomutase-like phosphatase (HAD superfamily)
MNKQRKLDGEEARLLLGLDFDLTLTCHRVYGKKDFHRMIPYIWGGKERITRLQTFFQALMDNNVRIVIVSWNFEDIVRDALNMAGLLRYIHSIYDRGSVISHGGYQRGKENLLKTFSHSCGIPLERMVFVDDSPDVLQHITCCQTVLVEEAKEITPREMQRIARALDIDFEPG